MSIDGGGHTAFARGEAVGCECMGLFVKNQIQWRAPPLRKAQIRRFRDEAERTGIGPLIAHATYLINLASPQPALRRQSLRALGTDLRRCAALGIDCLVVHPGSHRGTGEAAGIQRIADALRHLVEHHVGEPTRILLETTAGGGAALGGTFEQLTAMMARAGNPKRIGVCLDTAHLHAAGYELRTDGGYEATVETLDENVGVDRVWAIHLNDTQYDLGSHRDRHAHIGTGQLGRATFRRILADPRWAGLPMILETPKGKDQRGRDWDAVSLRLLKRLRREVDRKS
jgi:deoxyribonuclease-4